MSTGTAGGTGPHQFYVTHCARTDSVLNTVGFSVRASSSTEPGLLKSAMEYPAYELPMDMWAKKPGRSEAPRRLARVRVDGGVMVVHTSYLEKDTMNRDRSYFTHVVLLPEARPADILKSWNSEGWMTDYASGQDKALKAPRGLMPPGSEVSDKVLGEFLTAKDLGQSGPLARAVWPERLRADPVARRLLVGRVIHGVLLASSDASRGRLFIHAEPGLVALLVYAVAQLLPPTEVSDLTFTTYEPAHRGLREYKRALVVGTYLANPAKGLEPELVTARGYAVDTVNPARGSKELLGELPPGVAYLVDMTAANKRESVKVIHEFFTAGRVTVANLGRVVPLAGALERLYHGSQTGDDLVALQKDPLGRNAIAAREEALWPQVRALAVDQDRSDIREAFKPWFTTPNRVDQLTAAGFAALVSRNDTGWASNWRVLQSVLPNSTQLGAALDRLLTRQQDSIQLLSPTARRVLRAGLGAVPAMNPKTIAPLLSPSNVTELDDLLTDPSLPSWGAAYAILIARLSQDRPMHVRVGKYLTTANQGVLGEYARNIEPYLDDHQVLANELFDLAADGTAAQFDRLLNTGSEFVSPARWMWAANRINLFEGKNWLPALTTKSRLAKFLRAVGADPVGRPAWDWVRVQIDVSILDERSWARVVWAELDRADVLISNEGADPRTVVPPRLAKLRDAGRVLLALTDNTGQQHSFSSDQVRAAFQAFHLVDQMGLQEIFNRNCQDTNPANNPKAFERFADVFGSLFPPSETVFQANNRALDNWLAIIASAPVENQRSLQEFFFGDTRLAPKSPSQRLALLDEPRKPPIVSAVADKVRFLATQAEEKTAAKVVKRKGRGKGKKSPSWKSTRPIVGMVVLVILVLILGVWLAKNRKSPNQDMASDTQPVTPQTPTQPSIQQPAVTPQPGMTTPNTTPNVPPPLNPNVANSPKAIMPDKPGDRMIEPKIKAFRDWHKDVTATREALSKRYTEVKFGALDDLEDKKNALFIRYDAFDDRVKPLTPAEQDSEKVNDLRIQISNDKHDWPILLQLLVHYQQSILRISSHDGKIWLDKIIDHYSELTGERAKALVRAKVPQFCDEFLPAKLALDDFVQYDGAEVVSIPRSELRARFKVSKEELVEKDLTDDPEGLNEQTCKVEKGFVEFFRRPMPGSPLTTAKVKGKDQSLKAVAYTNARKLVAAGTEWSVVVDKLHNAIGRNNQLKWRLVGQSNKLEEFDIRGRLTIVEKAIKDHPALFKEPGLSKQ